MAGKEKKSGLKKFLEENKTLVFTIPVFIVLLIVLVVVLLGNNGSTKSEISPVRTKTVEQQPAETKEAILEETSNSDSGTEGTTLPQNEREKDSDEISRNPFSDPYRVSGIIYDKAGGSIAIIEAENKSYIVKAAEEVDGYFKVLKIEENRVVLEADGKELVLILPTD